MTDLRPVGVSEVPNAVEDQPQNLLRKQIQYWDVVFTFPNLPNRIEAHQLYLMAGSPVFQQMFRKRKSGNAHVREIEISESTPERFQEFLEFIYTDKFEVNAAGALDLLHLAQNAVQIFETACRNGHEDLADRAGRIMARSFAYLVENDALAGAQEDTLIYLLKRDDLAMKEVALFDFVLKWGKTQVSYSEGDCLLEDKLKKVIPLIRYTNMTPQEFSAVVLPTRLLSAEDMLSVYSYVAGDEAMRRNIMLKFNTTARKLQGPAALVDFFGGEGNASSRSKSTNSKPLKLCISFQVQPFKKVGSENVLQKPAITAIKVIWPSRLVQHSEMTDRSLNFNVCVKESFSQVNVRNARLRFGKDLLNRKGGNQDEIPVEPPVELLPGLTYCVIVEDLADHHDYPSSDDNHECVKYMYFGRFSPYDLRPEASVHLEGIDVELKKIEKDNRLANRSDSTPHFPINVIRGIKISLV